MNTVKEEAMKYKSVDEFTQHISDKLYALNKKAKSFGLKTVSGDYQKYNPEYQSKLYNIKDNIVKELGEPTGEIHKFINTKGFISGFGELYKLGDNTFHTFMPSWKMEENIGNKIAKKYGLELDIYPFNDEFYIKGGDELMNEKANLDLKNSIIDLYKNTKLVKPPKENIKGIELKDSDIDFLEKLSNLKKEQLKQIFK